jgi:hypothetical protein
MRRANTPTGPLRLPDTGVGTFSQAMYDMAVKQGWVVVSMKKDWRRIFAFDQLDVAKRRAYIG